MSRPFLLQLIYAWCKIEWIELSKLFIIIPIFDRLWSHYSEFPFVEVDEQKLLTLRLPPALLLLLPLKKQVVVNKILTTISSLPSHCSKNLGAVQDLEISRVNYGFVVARFKMPEKLEVVGRWPPPAPSSMLPPLPWVGHLGQYL